MAKKCFKCGKVKSLREFYRHKMMADGHLNKCIECTLKDVQQHRQKNIDKIRAYDRVRGQNEKRKIANKQRYRKVVSTKKGRIKTFARAKAWIERNQIKRGAHILVEVALRDGQLIKQPCERCGTRRKIQAHHEDYNFPLQVTWLCIKHHGERHRELNEIRRQQEAKKRKKQ